MRFLFTLVLALLISGCSDKGEQPGLTDTKSALSGEITAPAESAVSIFPTDATVESVLSVRLDDSLPVNGELVWYVNESQSTIKSMRFSSPTLRKGDVVQAVVRTTKKEFPSNKVIIRNSPPVVTRASLLPAVPKITDVLAVEVNARDSDGDPVNYSYKWSHNGAHVSNDETLATELRRDDTITVEVTPSDGDDRGKPVVLKSKVYNSLPVLAESEPVFDGTVYKYKILATDPDGDVLTYTLRDAPEGMTIDGKTGEITWEVSPKELGFYEIEVSVKDDHGGELIIPFTTNIGIEERS